MRKSVLTGVVAFLLGAAGSPKAANDNETMAMLCARFTAAHGPARIHEIRVTIPKFGISAASFNGEANALEIMQRTLCR